MVFFLLFATPMIIADAARTRHKHTGAGKARSGYKGPFTTFINFVVVVVIIIIIPRQKHCG